MMKKILIITNKDDITVDFIVRLLRRDGIDYYRFNTEDLFNTIDVRFRVDEGKYILFDRNKDVVIDLDEFSSVYFRRPGLPDFSLVEDITLTERRYLIREAASIIDGIYKKLGNCFWINNVFRIREAENKLYQLQLAKKIGFLIPETILSNDAKFVRDNFYKDSSSELVIKAVRSGNIEPETAKKIVFTTDINLDEITRDSIGMFPAYIQSKISKKSDLRCIVVGNNVFTAEINSQDDEDATTDWRKSKSILEHRKYELPEDIKDKCVAITKKLGLFYSAIDLVLDKDGNYIFLECNPNGQWAWIENRINVPISNTIEELLINGGAL